MLSLFILALQTPERLSTDLDMRPPAAGEVGAAERRAARQVPAIVEVCRNALATSDPDGFIKAFADRNGLSSYGRVSLSTQCQIYQKGVTDGEALNQSRTK
ncbi:hypothetical protein ASE70_11810 [Sphingomonas sp. Leaf22]|nr:hypothetical protein ASE70_11810 [Sphingomonas sp. Leaf22]